MLLSEDEDEELNRLPLLYWKGFCLNMSKIKKIQIKITHVEKYKSIFISLMQNVLTRIIFPTVFIFLFFIIIEIVLYRHDKRRN